MKKQYFVCIALIALLSFVSLPLFSQGSKDSAVDGPVSIDLWYGAAVTEAGPPPADWVGFDIIKEKLNIDLKLTTLPSNESDQDVKIQAAAAANNLPDLFMVRRDVLARLVSQGLVAPVDDLYEKMPTRTATHYNEVSRNHTKFNGKSYGLADPGSIVKNEGLLIRKDWLDNLGLSIPTTTDELLDVMRAFTFDDPDGNGKNDTYGYGAFQEVNNYEAWPGRRLEPILGAFGVEGTWDMTVANAGLTILKPEFYDAMVYLKKMVDEGIIDPNWLAYKKDDFRAAWKQGRFGIMREQNAAFAAQSNYAPFDKNFPNGEWVVMDPIKGPKGHASIGPYTAGFRIYAISAKAVEEGKKEKIAELLEWMASDEGYYLLGWGVEGVNYTKDANGIPVADGLPDPDLAFSGPVGQTVTQLRNMVFYNGDIELYARYPKYITATSKKEMSALDVLRTMQSKQWTPAIGSDMLPIPSADLKRFYEQGLSEFITGKRTLNRTNWNTWIAEFKKLGGQDWNDKGVAFAKENNLLNE
ncbi:extracellular solute-binding protein [Sphaerochaeta halotolerans]|jgi:putative aldouronate transport system substrate-binding protein|uniref:Extracellular solute-binding protein n=1 Tax=Sphaerochaeta halotolerans TaxID=2293840 RepID=A0A372MJR9_9SPIR|nr:extracellular solute-binding protein [Sphaerochaeta halotolerans]MBG0767542.1 extracellular solute-binding protein [Spirochaetaceae bacterium]MDK2859118.1 putative aldouronate transport system substrate-binding protein [Sphaerochaeta sp.]MDN5333605.1 putative aldouronate transport system substrate-binding protein [Sphaerochaeta sp.]MXI87273.1 extracellular solute-binding protein [Sphaerochaeta halotolerans]RFU96025.1 extracellular solute-binding protein [Sphaerochaeta halotolerans]